MKKRLFFLILFVAVSVAKAQVFMVCNPSGNSCIPYNSFDDAVTNALHDDYIYLPGGIYNISAQITKKLHIIGAGFNVDSSAVTEPTFLMGYLQVTNGGEGSSFEGFYLSGNFTTPTPNDTIRNCTLQRVCINGLFGGNIINCNSYQCVFQNVVYTNNPNTTIVCGNFNNCIFSNYLQNWNSSIVQNCLFIGNSAHSIWHCTGLIVKNSIVAGNYFATNDWWQCAYGAGPNSNIVAYNNLIINDWGCGGGLVAYTNNIVASPCLDNFDICPLGVFVSTNNYNLKSTSPAKNAGTDGTDIGIYGGAMPWKDGSVPGNPHIYYKNISSSTNSNNSLPVHIKVRSSN